MTVTTAAPRSRGLIKTLRGQYEAGAWDGTNASGWSPIGDKVLVKPDKAAAKVGSLYMPDQEIEKQQLAAESGILIEVGCEAFKRNRDTGLPWDGVAPKPGDRVSFARYSGTQCMGLDGEMYFTMSDSCIGAVQSTGGDQ